MKSVLLDDQGCPSWVGVQKSAPKKDYRKRLLGPLQDRHLCVRPLRDQNLFPSPHSGDLGYMVMFSIGFCMHECRSREW